MTLLIFAISPMSDERFLEEQAAGTRQSEPGKEFGFMIPRNRLCGHEGSSLPPMKNWGIASPYLLGVGQHDWSAD